MLDRQLLPFRFGILAEHALTRTLLVETARRAEDAGHAALLLRDHLIEEPFGRQLALLPALSAVAALTGQLRVGTFVCCNDFRHLVVLAKETATLDVLSEGRFELGLGAGFFEAEYEQAGLPYDPPGLRVDHLEEAIQVIKGLLADDPFSRLELSTTVSLVVADHRGAAAERFAEERGWDDVTVRDILAIPAVFIGSVNQIIEDMHDRRER
ncbi:MAG TPA: LLM class flavin-dependent oxidoreductase [Thermomicrobiales bacterium]|nr:LLM class flavin-dependent oxidoreductase [Thermomicrobiales bacterium]